MSVGSNVLLRVEHLTMRFGGLTAIDDVSFEAGDREITAIIGPNGAGKTTIFNTLTGFYRPTVGRLSLHHPSGQTYFLERMEGHHIAQHAGVARTFQNIRLFPRMTVLENLILAQHNRLMRASGYTVFGLFGLKVYRDAEAEAVEKAKFWLDKIDLTDRADVEAGNLAYGDQRRLEIVRAMCADPVLLCLDEPAVGLNPRESADLNRLLRFIRDEMGTGILLIEHDMSVVMEISDHVVVIDYGKKISDGTPESVRNDPAVIRAYLGEEEDAELPVVVARDLAAEKDAPARGRTARQKIAALAEEQEASAPKKTGKRTVKRTGRTKRLAAEPTTRTKTEMEAAESTRRHTGRKPTGGGRGGRRKGDE